MTGQNYIFEREKLVVYSNQQVSNNVLVSYSAGRTSSFMAYTMLRDPFWSSKNIVFIMANTGKEMEETLKFADRCDREFGLNLVWVEADVNPEMGEGTTFKKTDFCHASRNGEPFEAMIKKYGIPNKPFPHCTRELKTRPINAYAKTLFGDDYVTAIGIRFDELRRFKRKPKIVYPLIEWMITVDTVRAFWNQQSFDLEIKDYQGNCDLCWKKSLRKQLTIIKENPQLSNWWTDMEDKYSMLQVPDREIISSPSFFHRENKSTLSLVELANRPFVPATDPYWRNDRSDEMDDEQSCACMSSSEVDP